MKQKLRSKANGITLISLVVTVIVLIILTGIGLYLVLGENNIIDKAKESKTMVDISTAQERLELVKGPIQIEKYSVNLDDYLAELEKVREQYSVTSVEKINEINAEIIISGKYKFLAIDEENGNVKIIYLGEAGKLKISPTSGEIEHPMTATFEVIENESGGELTVESENEKVATATINGNIVTVNAGEQRGTIKIIVRSAANGKYAQGRATYTVMVNRGRITLSATAYTGAYDGKDHDAITSVTVSPTDAKIEYSLNGGEWSTTIPKVNRPDNYSVSIRATKEGYVTETITKTITIKNLVTGIELDKTSIELYIEDDGTNITNTTETITATITPTDAENKTIEWSSSDQNVAIVKDGEVTPIGKGTATITATAQDGSGISANCEVTVIKRTYIYKEGIKNTNLIGAWVKGSFKGGSCQYIDNANNGYICMKTSGSAGEEHVHNAGYRTKNLIDFSGYSKLKATMKVNLKATVNGLTGDGTHGATGIWFKTKSEYNDGFGGFHYRDTAGKSTLATHNKTEGTFQIDITNYQDSYYVMLVSRSYIGKATVSYFYSIWLE